MLHGIVYIELLFVSLCHFDNDIPPPQIPYPLWPFRGLGDGNWDPMLGITCPEPRPWTPNFTWSLLVPFSYPTFSIHFSSTFLRCDSCVEQMKGWLYTSYEQLKMLASRPPCQTLPLHSLISCAQPGHDWSNCSAQLRTWANCCGLHNVFYRGCPTSKF